MRAARKGHARTCAATASVHTGLSAHRAPHVVDCVCANFRKKNFLPPSAGKSLSFPFVSRRRGGFEPMSTTGKPSFDHFSPHLAEQGPLPWAPILCGAHRGHVTQPFLLLSI